MSSPPARGVCANAGAASIASTATARARRDLIEASPRRRAGWPCSWQFPGTEAVKFPREIALTGAIHDPVPDESALETREVSAQRLESLGGSVQAVETVQALAQHPWASFAWGPDTRLRVLIDFPQSPCSLGLQLRCGVQSRVWRFGLCMADRALGAELQGEACRGHRPPPTAGQGDGHHATEHEDGGRQRDLAREALAGSHRLSQVLGVPPVTLLLGSGRPWYGAPGPSKRYRDSPVDRNQAMWCTVTLGQNAAPPRRNASASRPAGSISTNLTRSGPGRFRAEREFVLRVIRSPTLEAVPPNSPMEATMKKKATKGARKSKVRDLTTRKRAAARVKAGAASTPVQAKETLQLDSCWLENNVVRRG